MAFDPLIYLVEYKSGASWVTIPTSALLDLTPRIAVAGGEHPLLFGDSSDATCQIVVRLAALSDLALDTPIRVTFQRGAAAGARVFTGRVASRSRTVARLTLACASFVGLIQKTKAYTRATYRRPIATKTSAASVEDPAAGGYQGGLLNELWWRAGGRPASQDTTYTSASFYYACDQPPLVVDWPWTNGEDAWAASQDAVRVVAGQVFQDEAGIIRYRSPYAFVGGVQTYTFTASDYGPDINQELRAGASAGTYIAQWIRRSRRTAQDVYDDRPYRMIAAGQSETFDLDIQYPIAALNTAATDILNVTFPGDALVVEGAGYTKAITWYAQRVVLTVTNTSTRPIQVNRIKLSGTPITAGEGGMARYTGTGTGEKQLDQNPLIQNPIHARRLVQLYATMIGVPRNVVTLEAAYDPVRFVGERVGLTVSEWGLSNAAHVILSRDISKTGRTRYTLADVQNLPQAADYFLIGSSSYTGQTKYAGI